MTPCNQPPLSIVAGTAVVFRASLYPSDTYTLQFAFNNGVAAPTVVNATVDGYGFLITTTAPAAPGVYAWGEVYSKISDATKYAGRQGTTTVTPSPLVVATPSTAATILGKLLTAYSSRADNTKGSASFNGQSVTWNSPSELQSQITYWQAIVYAEQRAAAAQRGDADPSLIRPHFLPPFSGCSSR